MKRKNYLWYTLAAVLCTATISLTGCSSDEPAVDNTPVEVKLSPEQSEVVQAENTFALKVMDVLVNDEENLLLSPASLNTAMYMCANDALEPSVMLEFLGFDANKTDITAINDMHSSMWRMLTKADPKVDIVSANAAWGVGEFMLPGDVAKVLKSSYDAKVGNTSPDKIQSEVDKFVSSKTKGVINEFKLPGMIEGLLFVNALYFKGEWKDKFDASKTYSGTFHNSDGSQSTVKMMESRNGKIVKSDEYDVLCLPYGNGSFEMMFVLPTEGRKLSEVMKSISSDELKRISLLPKGETYPVGQAIVPRFKIEGEQLDLIPAFGHLGLPEIILRGANNKYVSFNYAQQKTCIEVNEDGSEAASVSVVGNITISTGNWVDMTLDRPFGFYVREKNSGAIIVMGAVNRL